MISRMLSTPVLLAASISIVSNAVPLAMVKQASHLPQGSGVGRSLVRQFKDFAKILALDVFPVPLGPVNRYAVAIFSCFKALVRVNAIVS